MAEPIYIRRDTVVLLTFCAFMFIWIDYDIFVRMGWRPRMPSCTTLINLWSIYRNLGIELVSEPEVDKHFLSRNTKQVFDDFIKMSHVKFVGFFHIINQSVSGVLHPVDHFTKHYFDRYYIKECAQAFSTYKRTNPTLFLRLKHLNLFGILNPISVTQDDVHAAFSEIFEDTVYNPNFSVFEAEVKECVDNKRFESLSIDYSSAAGYPFKQGTKRRSCTLEAVNRANDLLESDYEFEKYASDHVWYTTGRARMQKVASELKGRLIMYAGYSFMLIAMLFAQPWARFMNNSFDWCGVGMSWMHGGARKFADFFHAEHGFAPKGFRYVSIDIKEWDATLNPIYFIGLLKFFMNVMKKADVESEYRSRFHAIYMDMVNAKVLFPLGYLFRVHQGMKSGWCNTANDNTIIHEAVFRIIMRSTGHIKHMLYGDDNFMLVPDNISDEMLVDAYNRCGLTVGRIHSSRYIGDVDFLSKYIVHKEGDYYIFRPTVETVARILMPEELNPRMRDKPDPVIAAERLLGHLIDNPFNHRVRDICYRLLKMLRDKYALYYIDLDPNVLKNHPWRDFDLAKIPKRFPTVPDFDGILSLYGVSFTNITSRWPGYPVVHEMDVSKQDFDSLRFDAVSSYSDNVMARLYSKGDKVRKCITKWNSPFHVPTGCYGFHAARMCFMLNKLEVSFDSALDLGANPGACTASLLDLCDDVTAVDIEDVEIPYAVGDVARIKCDVNNYLPNRRFDFIHDDVDVHRARTRHEEIAIGVAALKRSVKFAKHCSYYMLTLREFNSQSMNALFDAYQTYGHVDLIKPLFSNPWKVEFCVMLRNVHGDRMRKTTLMHCVNGFINSLSGDIAAWADKIADAIMTYGSADVTKCPYQTDFKSEAEASIKVRESTGHHF